MITFATLLALAAAMIMLQKWETKTGAAQPIKVETDEELRKRYQNRNRF